MAAAGGPEASPPAAASPPNAVDQSSAAGDGPSYAQSISGAEGVQHLRDLISQTADQKAKNTTRSWVLIGICAGSALAILLTLYVVYSATVLSYATLEDVKVLQDAQVANRVSISFDVVGKGKVRFENRSGRFYAEKLDQYPETGPQAMFWAWNYDPEDGIHFTVRYRKGLFPARVTKHFAGTE